MPLAEIVAAGAAATQAFAQVLQTLNGARSVVLEVDNNTGMTLTRAWDNHEHGGFAVTPLSEIPPHMADVFGSQNTGGSLFTGTEGNVTYRGSDGLEFNISWDNPFAGGNSCNATVNTRKYRVVSTCGAGNTSAHMRYELFEIDMRGFNVFGAILDKWAETNYSAGPLRFPTSNEIPTFDGVGRFQNFEGGIISWHPETGAHIVWGLIGERWLQIGREQFGYPITDETPTPNGRGMYNHFRAVHLPEKPEASIHWSPESGAHETYGGSRTKWAEMGWEGSPLGFPVDHENSTFDSVGRAQSFQGGMISWHPETGAHAVWGLIGERWLQIGREQFGYPITDETSTFDGRGLFNHFRAVHLPEKPEVSIYWSPESGVHEIFGAIRTKWAEMGWERSHLGYPVSAEEDYAGGRIQRFQGGALLWTPEAGVFVQ